MLKQVRLVNVCQHESLTWNPGSGLTVVVGPQGSGKSNLLSMALSSLTGVNPLPGVKGDNIREGIGKNDQSYIETRWEFGGVRYDILRGLKKVKSTIAVDGEIITSVRRESEITSFILEKAGIDDSKVYNFSYVSQGQTDALLTSKPTDRVRFMARLFEVEQVLDWPDKAREASRRITANLEADYASRIREIYAETRSLAKELAAERKRLSEVDTRLTSLYGEFEAVSAMAEKAALQRTLDERIARLTHSRQVAELRVAKSKEEIDRLQSEVPEWQRFVEVVAQWTEVAKNNSKLEAMQTEFNKLTNEIRRDLLDEPVEPVKPNFELPDEPTVQSVAVELATLVKQYDLFCEGRPTCDKCGAPISLDEESGLRLKVKIKQLSSQLAAWQQQSKLHTQYGQDLAVFRRHREMWSSSIADKTVKLEAVKQQISRSGLQMVELPEIMREDPNRLWRDRAKLESLTKELAERSAELPELESNLADVESKLLKAKAEREELGELPAFDQQAYKTQLAVFKAVEAEKSEAAANISRINRAAGSAKEQLKQYIAKYRRQRIDLVAKQSIDELCENVKPSALPSQIIYRMCSGVSEKMSELCHQLGQPFSIYIDEELKFWATKSDGRCERVERLSGGQRACVATVFWLVRLMSLTSSKLKFLVLDEPTAHMDQAVVGQFGEMLTALNPLLIESGVQVILVTHHRQLAGCGQTVLNLGDV